MRFIIALVILLVVNSRSHAQVSAPPRDLISVGTAAPEVASLGKFGNIPVSPCTGVPGISIPIYTINAGKIKLPVSLDYHAGGIRIDEVSSSVGIGWALNGNGMIFRNMIGRPDEEAGSGFIAAPEGNLVAMAKSMYLPYLYSVHQGQGDAEPDIFQYNFNGQSGKFIFRHDGSVMQIPATNNKIVFSGASFTITDANGVVYIFDEKQSTQLSGDPGVSYTSQWRLTKMIDANTTDAIYFSYESVCNTSYEHTANASFTIGMLSGDCGVHGESGTDFTQATCSANLGSGGSTFFQTITHNESYLKQISWRGGRMVFVNVCDRQDVYGAGERLDEVDVYASTNDVETQTKRIKLYQSYFFSNPMINTTATEKNYRLKLDSVAYLPVGTNDQPQVYSMTYDNTDMAPRESYAEDRWGFNNGQFSNSGYMPAQSAVYNGLYYDFGFANRETDPAYMLACNIKSIRYPTKGESDFEFEPHRYKTDFSATEPVSVYCDAYGNIQSYNERTFTVEEHSSTYSYQVFISKFINTDVTDRPRVILKDQTTGEQLFSLSQTPGNEALDYNSGRVALTLVPGHSYLLTSNIYNTTNSSVSAKATISWVDTIPNSPEVKLGGGLRVKTITNYDLDGNFINREKYEYGDDNTGIILTPQYYQDINFEKVVHRVGCPGGALDPSCAPFFEYDPTLNPAVGYSLLYHANSIYPTSQYSGSPVLYRKVTKYEVDAADNPNGKTVFYYQVYQDGSTISNNGISDPVPSDYNTSGIFLISNTWKNGFPTGEETYKLKNGNYYLETKKSTTYLTANSDNQSVLKIKPWYYSTGCDNVNDAASCALYDVRITTGTMLPITIVESTVDDANNNLSSTQNITYNSDLYPIQRHTVKSNGDDIIENIKYPGDFSASGNVYAKMIARHIISPVIQSQKLVGGTQTLLTKVNYNDWFGDNTLLEPSSVEMQTGSNPSEVRVMFNQYDVMGNIIQQQKTNDAFQTYIWDYNSTYPIAVVKNATQSDVAYTSFEAEGTGNWSGITSNDLQSAPSPTGSNYYTLSPEGLTKDGLSATTTYIVSYWSKNGAYSITGTASVKTGRSITIGGGNWTCYEHLVTGTSSITVTGTGGIDELRLYPATAQMTTYAYTPLIGMITQCDVASRIIYYQYDGLGRLKVVKDQDGNIIKTLNYHYKQ